MRARMARVLASMHSPQWRSRYGAEFEALLVDLPASPANLADVAGSIVASRRSPIAFVLGILLVALTMAVVLAKHGSPATATVSQYPVAGARIACAIFTKHFRRVKPCAMG
jgi:hypothetical protein